MGDHPPRRATLRTHEGEQQLRQGDVVAFPRARKARTRSATTRTRRPRPHALHADAPDIVEYLDTARRRAGVAGERIIFARLGPELEYWEDED